MIPGIVASNYLSAPPAPSPLIGGRMVLSRQASGDNISIYDVSGTLALTPLGTTRGDTTASAAYPVSMHPQRTEFTAFRNRFIYTGGQWVRSTWTPTDVPSGRTVVPLMPSYSPDGLWLAFAWMPSGAALPSRVAIFRTDTGQQVASFTGGAALSPVEATLAWTDDSTAFARSVRNPNTTSAGGLYICRLSGGVWSQPIASAAVTDPISVAWTHDQQSLVVSQGTTNTNLYTVGATNVTLAGTLLAGAALRLSRNKPILPADTYSDYIAGAYSSGTGSTAVSRLYYLRRDAGGAWASPLLIEERPGDTYLANSYQRVQVNGSGEAVYWITPNAPYLTVWSTANDTLTRIAEPNPWITAVQSNIDIV